MACSGNVKFAFYNPYEIRCVCCVLAHSNYYGKYMSRAENHIIYFSVMEKTAWQAYQLQQLKVRIHYDVAIRTSKLHLLYTCKIAVKHLFQQCNNVAVLTFNS